MSTQPQWLDTTATALQDMSAQQCRTTGAGGAVGEVQMQDKSGLLLLGSFACMRAGTVAVASPAAALARVWELTAVCRRCAAMQLHQHMVPKLPSNAPDLRFAALASCAVAPGRTHCM
jgi:hypothetical protein